VGQIHNIRMLAGVATVRLEIYILTHVFRDESRNVNLTEMRGG